MLDVLEEEGIGGIAFSPLAQGILTGKYLNGIPADSRAAGASVFLTANQITGEITEITRSLKEMAEERGQSMAQMALAWVLHQKAMTSVILGASSSIQIQENLKTLQSLQFTHEELERIDQILYHKESIDE